MCYHRLYIFSTCGHWLFAQTPTRPCAHYTLKHSISPSIFAITAPPYTNRSHHDPKPNAVEVGNGSALHRRRKSSVKRPDLPRLKTETEPCTPQAHPFLTYRLYTTCLSCQRLRAKLLESLDDGKVVRWSSARSDSVRSPTNYGSPTSTAGSEAWARWRDSIAAAGSKVVQRRLNGLQDVGRRRAGTGSSVASGSSDVSQLKSPLVGGLEEMLGKTAVKASGAEASERNGDGVGQVTLRRTLT